MTPARLTKLLTTAIPARLKVLIVSEPGCGKTEICQLATKRAKAALVTCHPAVEEPTDYKGLPAKVGTAANPRAEFLPYGQLRKLIDAENLTCCFFDDIGQAPHATQAALMQPLQQREIDGKRISDHVTFIGATNDTSHMAGVHAILEPVKSRWDTIVHLEVSINEWVPWAVRNAMPGSLVGFIRFRGIKSLLDFTPTRELKNSPNPRNVSSAGKWIQAGAIDLEVLAGACGEGWAAEYLAFHKSWEAIEEILEKALTMPTIAPLPGSDPSLQYAIATAISFRANSENFGNALAYLDRLPKEFEVFAARDAIARDASLTGTSAWTTWCTTNHATLTAA